MAKTKTGRRLEIVAQILFFPVGCAQAAGGSFCVRRIRAYEPKCYDFQPYGHTLGRAGVSSRYGCLKRTWPRCIRRLALLPDWAFWTGSFPGAKVGPDYGCVEEWVGGWIPVLGGRAFDIREPNAGDTRLPAFPPSGDQHLFIRMRRDDIDASGAVEDTEKAAAKLGHPATRRNDV